LVSSFISAPSRLVGLDGKGVDAVAELRSQDIVDDPVLGDPAQASEGWRSDDGAEVPPVACHGGARVWDFSLDVGGGCATPWLATDRGRGLYDRSDAVHLIDDLQLPEG
jgi:hypothetical protein